MVLTVLGREMKRLAKCVILVCACTVLVHGCTILVYGASPGVPSLHQSLQLSVQHIACN